MSLKYVQSLTLYQAGAGNIIGATSVVLTSLTDIYGNAITTMAPFGTKGYITLEPDTTNEEGATFTGITVNANNTVSLTGVSTTLAQSPYTETSGLVRQHSGGTKVVITDNVGFWNTFTNKNNDETVSGKWTLPNGANRPQLAADTDTAVAAELVTFGQLARQAIAGAANASTVVKGLVELATQAEVDARTTVGGSGALLVPTPDIMRSTLLSDYKVDTGAANAYVITPVPAITAYVTGQIFSFKAVNANTTVSTLNVSAVGAKTIKKGNGTTDLVAGDIAAGMIVVVEYDGTNLVMINPVAPIPATQTYANSLRYVGTGADGSATLDGTATVAWASKVGSVYTMTRDANLVNLTISGGVTLLTANFKLFGTSTLTNGGTISNDGVNGSGQTGGTNIATGTLGIGSKGGDGGGPAVGPGLPGQAGTSISHAIGSSSGTGGTIGGGGASAVVGAQGVVTPPSVVPNLLQSLYMLDCTTTGVFGYLAGAGAPGGGGGSNTVGFTGAGGGAGGNIVFISFFIVVNSGTISAKGGNAGTRGGDGGGAPGGGGGAIVIVTSSHTNSGSETVAGGTGTTGGGTGVTGNIYIITVTNV